MIGKNPHRLEAEFFSHLKERHQNELYEVRTITVDAKMFEVLISLVLSSVF